MARTLRHYLWVAPLVLGLVFIASGAFMLNEGRKAKDEVRTAIVEEKIVTSKDASIPEVPVTDAKTAQAQADAIKHHILTTTEGKTYAEMDRTDPNRAQYLNSVTLRTALNLAVMGFKVSDLVMGMGAFMVAIGLTQVAFLAPLLFWERAAAGEAAGAREPRAGGYVGGTAIQGR